MPRPEKVQAVAEIKERIEGAQAVFITEFRGLSVKQMQKLRSALRDSGAEYKVVKMTLARRATDELEIDGVSEHLLGPTGLTFADADPVATAKVLADTGKENEKFVIKAGIMSGQVILPEQVSRLAEIEPREVLLAKIAGAFKGPTQKAAGLFGAFTRNAATMFSQLLEKKESGEFVGAAAPAAPAADEPAAAAEEE
jgi:large subunit ribosomal protein L10